MKRILITGSSGGIGTIVCKHLGAQYDIVPFDLPLHDVRDMSVLMQAAEGCDAIIHLAWNTYTEHAGSERTAAENTDMFENVYCAARKVGVSRVIMASSVHAHTLMTSYNTRPLELLPPQVSVAPNNPYGAHKIFMETLGRVHAARGLEVICIRIGGVTADDVPITLPVERPLWISHADLVSLMITVLEKPIPPENGRFVSLWGMSRGASGWYDMTNPFDWVPYSELPPV